MFTHTKRYSDIPLALSGCGCDAKQNHRAGEETYLVRPNWSIMAARLFTVDGRPIDLNWSNLSA